MWLNVVVLLVVGIIVADLVSKPNGTSQLVKGVSGLWTTYANSLLGKTTNTSTGA